MAFNAEQQTLAPFNAYTPLSVTEVAIWLIRGLQTAVAKLLRPHCSYGTDEPLVWFAHTHTHKYCSYTHHTRCIRGISHPAGPSSQLQDLVHKLSWFDLSELSITVCVQRLIISHKHFIKEPVHPKLHIMYVSSHLSLVVSSHPVHFVLFSPVFKRFNSTAATLSRKCSS